MDTFEKILSEVDSATRNEFEKFINEGDADKAFLQRLDTDEGLQKLVERAFKIQAQAFERMADQLRVVEQEKAVDETESDDESLSDDDTRQTFEVLVGPSNLSDSSKIRLVDDLMHRLQHLNPISQRKARNAAHELANEFSEADSKDSN